MRSAKPYYNQLGEILFLFFRAFHKKKSKSNENWLNKSDLKLHKTRARDRNLVSFFWLFSAFTFPSCRYHGFAEHPEFVNHTRYSYIWLFIMGFSDSAFLQWIWKSCLQINDGDDFLRMMIIIQEIILRSTKCLGKWVSDASRLDLVISE